MAGRATVGMYHLGWEVDTLSELDRMRSVLIDATSLVGASDHVTTKALYAHDPDGLEFEVSWLVPLELITEQDRASLKADWSPKPLDIRAEIERYGAETLGGVGVSIPVAPL
jgi:catechol-2,3-dioxygenase